MNRKKLVEKLKDPEYRRAFSSAQSRRTISTQIRRLRQSDERRWTQKELGERAEMKQNAIARLENPNYGEYSIRTLLRLADAFDVALVVKFAPFSELVDINQSASVEKYLPASFAQDASLLKVPSSQNRKQPVTWPGGLQEAGYTTAGGPIQGVGFTVTGGPTSIDESGFVGVQTFRALPQPEIHRSNYGN